MKRSGMNGTPERNGDEVNEPTASTWPENKPYFIFYCTIERVEGCVALGGCGGKKHGFIPFFTGCYGVGYLT